MFTMSDHNHETVVGYKNSVDSALDKLEEQGLNDSSDQYSYYVGALHAFEDTLELFDGGSPKEEKTKTEVDGRLLTGVVVITAAVVLYKPAKKVALKLKAKIRG